ncbi:MAG: DUF814 domain-containing protein [Planctomycetes bacterium]|nr:DUF814 domain-containing protein [Planctomycetota bacterium]
MRRSVRLLEPVVVGRRVQRFIQPDDDTLVLELYGWDDEAGEGNKTWLVLSADRELGRIALQNDSPNAPPWPPDFAALLKARMHRARVTGLRIVNDDRMAALLIEGKEGSFELLISLMGPRSNAYLLDLDGKLLGAMRPLSSTRGELKIGEPWANPPKPEGASEGGDHWHDIGDEVFLDAVAEHFADLSGKREYEQMRQRIAQALKKELDFAERRTDKIEKDLEEAKDAREKKRYGELLKQVMNTIDSGDTHVMARDFETDEEVKIPLDPKLSPAENLEKYFKKYHKGLVGANMLGQQLEITKSHTADMRGLRDELEAIDNIEALQAFAARPIIVELCDKHCPKEETKRPPKKKPTKKDVPGRMQPRRYKTSDGLEIWVGKSDAGNDYLTTKLAAGNDWFFHIEGYPGSHTVLRTGGRKDPPQESVLEAAELCTHFSKMKDASRVDVHVAPIKHVHKPKGAKPGLVHVSQGKTIGLRRDPKRLERILDARIKE